MKWDKKELENIGKKLKQQKQTVAVAESVTSGLLQAGFSQIPDASNFFQGGITVYNLGQKYKHLNVEPISAEACNCVSPEVTLQMAQEVTGKFKSDWGVSITGYITPTPESGHKLFCFFAVVFRGKVKAKGKLEPKEKLPEMIQIEYAQAVMKKLSLLL